MLNIFTAIYRTRILHRSDKAAQELTKKYIEGGQPTIFQAVFEAEGFLAALDVLKIDPKDGSFIIYEIKSTNDVDEKAHYHDLAFQVNLLRKLGYKIKSTYLIHLNAEYVRMGDLERGMGRKLG